MTYVRCNCSRTPFTINKAIEIQKKRKKSIWLQYKHHHHHQQELQQQKVKTPWKKRWQNWRKKIETNRNRETATRRTKAKKLYMHFHLWSCVVRPKSFVLVNSVDECICQSLSMRNTTKALLHTRHFAMIFFAFVWALQSTIVCICHIGCVSANVSLCYMYSLVCVMG